jgi:hypothetical protein
VGLTELSALEASPHLTRTQSRSTGTKLRPIILEAPLDVSLGRETEKDLYNYLE